MHAIKLDLDRANRWVLTKQHLTPDSKSADVVRVVRDIGGLHATLGTTPYLSLFARSTQFKGSDLDDELYRKRTLAKVRCVRKTIYVHTRDMIPVVLAATGNMVTGASRRYMESRGISSQEYDRISHAILKLLEGTEMTASAIKRMLQAEVDVSAVLYYMCDQGLLIRGKPDRSWRDRNHTYAVFRDHFPHIELGTLGESEAVAALVRQYLASFGPATEDDIVWWTGLGKRKVRMALGRLEDSLVKATITSLQASSGMGNDHFLLRSEASFAGQAKMPGNPIVNLLPTLDPYLMGYEERARYLDEKDSDYVFDRSGNATSTVLLNGRTAGVWDLEQRPRDGTEIVVKFFLFSGVSPRTLDEIRTQARDVGHFIAAIDGFAAGNVHLKEYDTMVPLTQRPAGSMMAPLKGC